MQHTPSRQPRPATTARERLNHFLIQRLTEELAQLWARDQARPQTTGHPGLASQLEVVDDILRVLTAGGIPERPDLIVLLVGYRNHPDYDPLFASGCGSAPDTRG